MMREVFQTPFKIINGRPYPVGIPSQVSKNNETGTSKTSGFDEILQDEINRDGIKISKHASERLESRNIRLDTTDISKLNDAMNKIKDKGGCESLILYKDTAFIASIKNKTIITAVDRESSKENVFTNIDSAMVLS